MTGGLSFNDLLHHNHKLKNDPVLSSRLLALCSRIIEVADGSESKLAPLRAAKSIVE